MVQIRLDFIRRLQGGEQPIRGDSPIVLYRKRRTKLQREAQVPTARDTP